MICYNRISLNSRKHPLKLSSTSKYQYSTLHFCSIYVSLQYKLWHIYDTSLSLSQADSNTNSHWLRQLLKQLLHTLYMPIIIKLFILLLTWYIFIMRHFPQCILYELSAYTMSSLTQVYISSPSVLFYFITQYTFSDYDF